MKKLLISFVASIILFASTLVLFAAPVKAQWYSQTYEEWIQIVTDESNPDEVFGERYTLAQVRWIIYSLVYFLTTADEGVFSCLSSNNGDIALCGTEILEAAESLNSADSSVNSSPLASFTSRPISSVAYFQDLARRLKIIPEAQAQGFGFEAATPILGLWRMVRNVTYFFIISVTVVFAFMIMFRVKIAPQTVITVQSALPKVIVAMILITFSYAIAGLMIDLMYVVIGILAAIVAQSGLTSSDDWSYMFNAFTERSVIITIIQFFILFMISLFASLFAGGWLPALLTTAATLGSEGLIWVLVALVVAIILFIALFKILWLLIKTYVSILLQIVFGPILILIGTLGQGGFGLWLKNLTAQLAVYPVVGFMFFLSFVFMRGAFVDYEEIMIVGRLGTLFLDSIWPYNITQNFSGTSWNPPMTIGSSGINVIWVFASLAILLMIPKVADIIKSLLEGRPFAYGTAIGEPIAMITGSYPVKAMRQELSEQTIKSGGPKVADFIQRVGPKRLHGLADRVRTASKRAGERT